MFKAKALYIEHTSERCSERMKNRPDNSELAKININIKNDTFNATIFVGYWAKERISKRVLQENKIP